MKFIDDELFASASDLVNFLGCKHLTELDRSEKLGEIKAPDFFDPAQDQLKQKGIEHEEAYTKHLEQNGYTTFKPTEHSNEATLEAMQQGYDYILQAYLSYEKWNGRVDFLRKVDGESNLGNYHYEVEDTKLAAETKSGSVLQLCLYSDLLSTLQGSEPENMWIVKPGLDFPIDKFRYPEFQSYYRFVKKQFEYAIDNRPKHTYPYPVAKCGTCRWWKHCDKQWHQDDHLSLIAGIQSLHLKELEKQNIKTLESYALLPHPFIDQPEQGSPITYQKIHDQSKIQLKGRKAGEMQYELLAVQSERGLNRLPEPTKGDIYFDIESDHFHEDGGLEYLLGYMFYTPTEGYEDYASIWSKNKLEEKKSFEQFIDFVMDRWDRYPNFYIYHYAPYEPSTLKRLAQYHRTKEVEIDRLLRGKRFIDLFSVLKESLRASVESYSLKDVEALTPCKRVANLRLSSMARRRIATTLEFKDEELSQHDIDLVEAYNKDDCLATAALHRFLEERYQECIKKGVHLQRPPIEDGLAADYIEERDIEAQEMFKMLVKDLPEDRSIWDSEQKARWLAAHLVEYYRREKKSAFWEYFRLQDMEPEDLLNERKAISGLSFTGTHPDTKPGANNVNIHTYSFPVQEVSMKEDNDLFEIQGDRIGSVYELLPDEGIISIKKTKKTSDIHPLSICTLETINDGVLETIDRF